MANEIEKLNHVALTSIEKFNGLTDANMQALNGREWTGLTTGTWSEAGNMSTGRSRMGNIGTVYTAMLFAAGNEDDPVSAANYLSTSEEWNGSSTSTTGGGGLASARQSLCAGGSQTAGFVTGGLINNSGTAAETATTENYNGSSWTSSGAMSETKEAAKGGGTQTSHWLWGGYKDGTGYREIMEIYNGSSWSSSTKALPNSEGARAYGIGGGLSDSTGVYAGGYSGPILNGTFTWDGSSWTQPSGSNLSDGRNGVQGGGHHTSMVVSSGRHWEDASRLDTTELWDGSTWSSGGTASTSTFACGSSGSFTSGNAQVAAAGGTRVNHDGLTTIQFYDRT